MMKYKFWNTAVNNGYDGELIEKIIPKQEKTKSATNKTKLENINK